MKCPTCANEVTPGEVFCGYCGTPAVATPPGYQAADRMDMPPSPHPGLFNSEAYAANTSFAPPGNSYQAEVPAQLRYEASPAPNSVPPPPATPYQQIGFYHDATEAISPIQNPGSYSDKSQFTPQAAPASYPFQTGNYAGPQPTHYPFATGQGYSYGSQGDFPPLPQKQGNHLLVIVCITLVVVLLGAVGITTFALLTRSNALQTTAIPPAVPTAAPTIAPTAVPTSAPTPSPVPTAAADAGFALCGINCSQYGFTTEFPVAWQGTPATNSLGVQFANPAMPNIYAAFKAPGATVNTPIDVLMSDVQSTFGAQAGYIAPTPPTTANATIGGTPWYAIATNYNDNQNQPIHVEVYATVYQGKAYIIELQAPQTNNQFDSVKQQFFVNMLVKFQFVPIAQ